MLSLQKRGECAPHTYKVTISYMELYINTDFRSVTQRPAKIRPAIQNTTRLLRQYHALVPRVLERRL